MRNRTLNPDSIIEKGGTHNISDILGRLRSSKGTGAPFSMAIVYEVLDDISTRDEEELLELSSDIGGDGFNALKRAPRNSLIASIVDGPDSSISSLKALCLPFFSPHLAMPVKPGELVWVYDPSPAGNSPYRYWISRVHEPLEVDDINYTHSLRRHDLYIDKSAGTSLAGEQGDAGEDNFTGKKEKGEVPGPPHFFDKPPDAQATESTAISNREIEENPNKAQLPVSEAPSAFDQLVRESQSYSNFTPEVVPRFTKRPGDFVIMGSNNSLICLGQDRGWNAINRPGEAENSNIQQPASYSGTIDVVAGRGMYLDGAAPDPDAPVVETQARSISNTRDNLEVDKNPAAYTNDPQRKDIAENRKDRPVEGDPDFINDASRIYVSMKTSPDANFGINAEAIHDVFEGTITDIEDSPAIIIKSNEIRISSREQGSIRIIKEGDKSATQASLYLTPEGIAQITAEKIYIGKANEGSGEGVAGSEPYVKYSELKALLEKVLDDVKSFCDTLNTHTTPGFGAPSPQINLAAANLLAAVAQRKAEIPNMRSARIFGE